MSDTSFINFLEAVITAYARLEPVKAALDRWLRLLMVGYLIWLIVVFALAYSGHPILSLIAVLSAWPLLILSYPGLSTAALAVTLFDHTTIGGLVTRVLSTVRKAVFSGAELAFTLGNDLNDIQTLDFTNPVLVVAFLIVWLAGFSQRLNGRPGGAFSLLSIAFALFLNAVNFTDVLPQVLYSLRGSLS